MPQPDFRHRPQQRFMTLPVLKALLLGLMLILTLPRAVNAAAGEKKPAATGGKKAHLAAPREPLTQQRVQDLITVAEKDDKLDEKNKADLLDILKRIQAQLRLADEWAARAADYEKARQEAPTKLDAIKTELNLPAVAPKVEVPPGATAATLEPLLVAPEASLAAAQKDLAKLETDLENRTKRRLKIPTEIATARKDLDDAAALGKSKSPETQRLTKARVALANVTARLCEQKISAYEKELASYDATNELLTAQRDLAARHREQADKLTQAWRAVVDKQRQIDAENTVAEARRIAAQAHPAVRHLAEANQRFAEERTGPTGLTNRITKATQKADETNKLLGKIKAEVNSVQQKDEIAGLANTIGVLLRKQRRELPDLDDLRQEIRQRQALIPEVNLKLLELQEDRTALADGIEAEVLAVMRPLDASITPEQRVSIEKTVRELLATRKELIKNLCLEYDTYFRKLVELDESQRRLDEKLSDYLKYIDERVLWIRSTQTLNLAVALDTGNALRWLVNPADWRAVGRSTWNRLHEELIPALGIFGLLGFLLSGQRRFRNKIKHFGKCAANESCTSFMLTIRSLFNTFMAALFWPLTIGLIGWLLVSPLDAPDLGKALGAGLLAMALPYFVIELLRQISRDNGIAEAHFGWPSPALRQVHRYLYRLQMLGLPLIFLTAVMNSQANEAFRESLGRLAMIAWLLLLAAFLHRMFQPRRGVFLPVLVLDPANWAARLRPVWYPLAVGIPLSLAGVAAVGYSYTAMQLAGRLLETVVLVLCLVMANELIHRWLMLARRKLALKQAPAEPASAESAALPEGNGHATANGPEKGQESASAPTPPTSPAPAAAAGNGAVATVIDLVAANIQSTRIRKSLVYFLLLIGVWLIWVDVLPALGILRRVVLWYDTAAQVTQVEKASFTSNLGLMGKISEPAGSAVAAGAMTSRVPVTLADLALCLVIFFMTVVAGGNIPGLLEITVLQRMKLDAGVRFAITTISRYVIVAIGIIVAFGAIRIGWGKVQWLVAAMTVGLGFGLQEIFANFISGLIILFERPIRVGDVVTVKDISGGVTRIQMRATTITDGDRRELIVPNKEFITGQLINWTLSDPITRVVIPVSVAYGSDTVLVRELLLEIARQNTNVLTDPAPAAAFVSFGESSLAFKLFVFIPSLAVHLTVTHDLHTAIDQAFRSASIAIAFPQRDLHLDISSPLPVRVMPEVVEKR